MDDITPRDRAIRCLLGHVAGDSLGGRYEFQSAPVVRNVLEDGGHWGLVAGQPTDDGELMITLGQSILDNGGFWDEAVLKAYQRWYRSAPFDIGLATRYAFRRRGQPNSAGVESNGALTRVAPIGIAYWRTPEIAYLMGRRDAALSHRSKLVCDLSGRYARAIAMSVTIGDPVATKWWLSTQEAMSAVPGSTGWVMNAYRIAFQSVRYIHKRSLRQALAHVVRMGGDTDTNAAITGALLGALGQELPKTWVQKIRTYDSSRGRHPRPAEYSANKIEELAQKLFDLDPV